MKIFLQRVGKKLANRSRSLVIVIAAAVSLALAHHSFAQASFKIDTLTANNITAIEANGQISDDRGGIAISTSKAFLVGDGNTGIWDRSNLSSPTTVGTTRDGIVMDIHSQFVYTFANSGTPVPSGSTLCPGTFTINQLIQLDPASGATTAVVINLSTPITVTGNAGSCPGTEAGVFSGYDRIILVSADGTAYNIDLPSGNVTNIGTITSSTYFGRSQAEGWATWGVAEFFGGDLYVTYVAEESIFPHKHIYRTKVSDNSDQLVADFSPQDLNDGHEFTAVPSLNRWYFHYEGGSFNPIAGSRDETLGFADATYTIAQSCAPPPANMVSWWPAENNGDDIISHNNLSLGPAGFSSGKVGQAFTFPANGFASAGTPSSLTNLPNGVTIDGWVNPSNAGQAVYFGRSVPFGNDYALFCLGGPTCILQSYIKINGSEHVLSDGQPVPT
ncbi:MAG TPA: hypothetical protein VIU85_06880, partial [Chthoniobacterales bacterium]